MRQSNIVPRFVALIPSQLEDGVLYISEQYQTAIHKCCCGCGEEVVTPLSSAQWRVRVVNYKVTLLPSVGNWNFSCKSHYWIKQNRVMWARSMTDSEIRYVQTRDRRDIERLTEFANNEKFNLLQSSQQQFNITTQPHFNYWKRLYKLMRMVLRI